MSRKAIYEPLFSSQSFMFLLSDSLKNFWIAKSISHIENKPHNTLSFPRTIDPT